MIYKLITAPTDEVIPIDVIKPQIGLFHNEKDAYISDYIKTAVELVESFTGRQLLTATWEAHFPCYRPEIFLKHCPVQEILSVKYYDLNNNLIELDLKDIDSIAYDLAAEPARLWFNNIFYTYERPDAIQIQFKAGYENVKLIPSVIIHAIIMMVGKMVENPVDSVENLPKASTNLLRNVRI